VVDEAAHIAIVNVAWVYARVVCGYVVKYLVDNLASWTAPELLSGKLASAVQIKRHGR
jgi:hypothetical protein